MEQKNKIFTITRVFNVPAETLWKAITERDQLKQWYFDFDTHFRLEKDATFEWTAGDPQGKQWLHKGRMLEIVKNKKLMHSWEYPGYTGSSVVTWALNALNENSTELLLTHEFVIPFDKNVEELKKEHFEKGWNAIISISLPDYIRKMSHKMANNKENFSIVRSFKAPKEVVFKAFSEAEALAQWWGPPGMPIQVVAFDFRPGGVFHFKMEGNGEVMWALFVYGHIASPDLIEFTNSFSDENRAICRAPFNPAWPLEIFNELTFTEESDITTLTMKGYPVNATDEEAAIYYAFTENMKEGFGATFDQLENYLSKQKNNI